MKFILQKLFLQSLTLSICVGALAQNAPSPEWEQMRLHAREYLARGDYKEAVITYKQALLLAPDSMEINEELGNALYLSGNYAGAEQTMLPLVTRPGAGITCFQLLAAIQAAGNEKKKSISTLHNGLAHFPLSGALYCDLGKSYTDEQKPEAALNAWLDGILKEPGYAENYHRAAMVYLDGDKILWGLLYGEMFLDMQHDTASDDELKNKLFAGYKTMFDNFANGIKITGNPASFENAVLQIYASLTPVISDGITTENLTMVRTRFLMDWFSLYAKKYPFSLFSYEDNLVRSGHFDIFNQWLFGKAEGKPQYEVWNSFHEGEMVRFLNWQATVRLQPFASDFYNSRDMKDLFNNKSEPH